MIKKVKISKRASKDLQKVPGYISDKLDAWVHDIELRGLEEVKKIPSYHDEPLSGVRKGQRSIRLSIHYRAFYVIRKDSVEFVEVQEVNKHEY